MTAATITAIERVKSLIKITESLSAIFVQENSLLSSHRPREIAPLQAEKARLAAAYAQSIRDIASNRASVEGADMVLLSKLRTITRTFEERAARQRALLSGAKQASEGIVKAVAEEAAAASGQASYGDQKKGETKAAPISLDEQA